MRIVEERGADKLTSGKMIYRMTVFLLLAGLIYLIRGYVSVYPVRSVGLTDWQAAQVVWIILLVCLLVCAVIVILQGLQTYLKKKGSFKRTNMRQIIEAGRRRIWKHVRLLAGKPECWVILSSGELEVLLWLNYW
ncbi:hypothetical protein [Paenibacillus sp. HGF7]|uniref:hypothetical protein n=1 Tax=Paenibacillus sp. HGF7 TaxID=944559 RepID=UPI00020D6E73|nr:hypothetical protein [Paenibacillus sp. HGF7]EGL20021.1 hypothetical protein HMPREF9413_1056 [Paenibacillus sp. HGF7]EPD82050.1 hypothetical protein HMPREF1207_03876 [Paenibacillus sp. HGH0039]